MRRRSIVICVVMLAVCATVPVIGAGVGAGAGVSAGVGTGADAAAGTNVQASSSSGCAYPTDLVDAGSGETVTVDEAPDSIVALGASDAQTAFEIGAGDRVTGLPQTPATATLDADNRTDVTEDDGYTTDVEAVVDLDPDVILAANVTPAETVEQLRDLEYAVYYFGEANSIDDVVANVETTGRLTGECERANATVEWMDGRFDLIESAAESADSESGYYEMMEGSTTGSGTFQHELLELAGVNNLAADAGIEGWGTISEEEILDRNPSWIVFDDSHEEPPVAERVTTTTAYREGNLIKIDANAFNQPAPAVVFAAGGLLEAVHPDAHAEIRGDLDALDDDYGTTAPDAAEIVDPAADSNESEAGSGGGAGNGGDGDDGGAGEEPIADAIPGLGAVAATVALLSAMAIVSRRR